MANTNSNRTLVPEAKDSLNQFKYEVATEVGVNLKNGYNGDITSNSKTKTITSSDTISVAKNIYLFNISQGGTAENRFGKFKLYYCKIWQGDTLVRDFVPVLDTEGKACLYDNVSKEYFYNSGSGEFSYQ